MQKSGISWCDCTWNPITGCSMKCKYCYARERACQMAKIPTWPAALLEAYRTFTPKLHENRLREPTKWKEPQTIFVGSMGDLFDNALDPRDRNRVLGAMTDVPHHTYLLLTKRPDIMFYSLHNLWMVEKNWRLGFTACDQKMFDSGRIHMERLATYGFKIFVSIEPMQGQINLRLKSSRISGVIVGGQTGKGAAPLNPEWVRDVRDQCVRADVPFHFKQWGEWTLCKTPQKVLLDDCGFTCRHESNLSDSGCFRPVGKKKAGRTLDGRVHDELGWELTG